MKSLIPVSFALAGAYLIGLPLQSHIKAVDILTQFINPQGAGSTFSSFPFAPYAHMLLPWISGTILIVFAIVLALKDYKSTIRS